MICWSMKGFSKSMVYDYDYVVKFTTGEPQVFHYEYKHHEPEKLPQLLSLYDTINPIVGERITSGKGSGKFKTKYMCMKPSFSNNEKFEFWTGYPFWKFHFEDANNGIPAIRAELAAKGVVLPVITVLDYFCFVKGTEGIPGRSDKKPYKADTIAELDVILNDAASDKIKLDWAKKNKQKMNKWLKYGRAHHAANPHVVLTFFQTLFDHRHTIANIRNNKSVENYLKQFMLDEDNKNSLVDRLFENIRVREAGKRFIFYYRKCAIWRMGEPYNDTFEKPLPGTPNVVTRTGTPSALTHLTVLTKSGNRLDFNLRWQNGLGLQNTAWQMNVFQGKGPGKKKLVPVIKRAPPANLEKCPFLGKKKATVKKATVKKATVKKATVKKAAPKPRSSSAVANIPPTSAANVKVSGLKTAKRQYKCAKCREKGLDVPKRNHICPYKEKKGGFRGGRKKTRRRQGGRRRSRRPGARRRRQTRKR